MLRRPKQKIPKDDQRLAWTEHAKRKMLHYRLSESRIRGVLAHPKRSERGIAPGTIALMQPTGTTKRPTEIWVMYQRTGKKKRIITAWRYPGKSPLREVIPIPDDIREELGRILGNKR